MTISPRVGETDMYSMLTLTQKYETCLLLTCCTLVPKGFNITDSGL